MKPKPSLLPEVRPTDPVLGGGSLRGTGVGSTTGEGEEESVVPSTKRARATGNKAYYVPKFLVNLVFILSVDVELPFLIIRNCHTHTHNRMPPYTSWNVC